MSTLQQKENGMVEITVEVGREAFHKAIEASYRKNVHKMNVPGFRRGKAPRKVVENMYGASVFYEDAVDIALPSAYLEAVGEHGLDPVGRPDMDITEINENGFTFTAVQAVRPEAKLKQYKGLSAPKDAVTVTDADVDAELERLRERNARIEDLQAPLSLGDIAVIDFEGFVDGKAFEGGKSSGQRLELGAGRFIPGFEEQLVGAGAGDSLEVKVTFPEEYHAAELAGKDAIFKVSVREAKKAVKPELDDDFAQDVSEFDTLGAFKDDIRERFQKQRERQADEAYESVLIEKLLEGFECDILDVMI
ncbi:MAG: trigger factor, partial [Oscillospiraceae bacterium]|nr:trigger factor [Oscillospiraceae bacterium]